MRSRVGVGLLACALIALIAGGFVMLPRFFGNGLIVTPATTSPARHSQRPPTIDPTHSVATGLLRSDDLHELGIKAGDSIQRQDGRQWLTGCTGKQTMADLAAGDRSRDSFASVVWRSAAAENGTTVLRESILRVPTSEAADRYGASLIEKLTGCRYRQHGRDRHLGNSSSVPTELGQAVRLVAYDADGTVVGGVGVFLDGRTVGVFDLVATDVGKPGAVLDSLSLAAVRRIG